MQNAALPIELHETNTPSIWPWVVGAVALILLSVTLRSNLHDIPLSLSRQAQALAERAGATAIDLNIDGRDLTLSGTLNAGVPRDQLVQRLSKIDGMRVVVDDMKEFDPAEQAIIEQLEFKQALASIDFRQVAFERGSASLTASSRTALLQLAQILQAYPDYRVRVSGHTDNTGRPEVNLRISRQRASSVADFLIDSRVNSNQIIAQGYGATRPTADNSTEAGRAANRRIEITYVN